MESSQKSRPTDAQLVEEGRKKVLKDSEELQVTVPLRDQIVEKLVKKLEELGEGYRTQDLWNQGNAQRTDWLERQRELLRHHDEFIEPIYDATNDWSSTLHLPISFTMVKTMHARFLAALLSIDPPFTAKARQSANVDRAALVQEFMRYILSSHANKYKGVEAVLDSWIWAWVTRGQGFLKNRWERCFTRYMDVQKRQELKTVISQIDPQSGQLIQIPQFEEIEEEKEVVIPTYDGPMVEHVANEDILLIGSNDPQEADHVLHSSYMTASQLWQLVDQGIFRKDAVENVIKYGDSRFGGEMTNLIKDQQLASSGVGYLDDGGLKEPRYQIIERHSRIPVDGSGIASDIILWVHKESGEILRATYLYRVMKTGLRPFFAIEFHRRQNGNPAGLPELLYSLAKEIDAVHNMKVDFGLISSMPFGFYRATSSLSEERMPLEPGALIPLDNPQTDIFFPNLGSRTGFTSQEEAMLMGQIERMTSISDITLGSMSSQGAARTATGARALLGESNANLDVYLRRMNRGWKACLVHLFHMCQDRIPDGFQFRVLGDDGQLYWETIRSREELAGMYDIELEPNSANSNRMVQIEQANGVLQTIANPFFIQLGIVTPANIFAALKNKLSIEGIRDWSRFISKPQGALRIYTPEEIANACLAGVDIKLGPEQDLQGFIEYFEYIMKHDELLGQFNQEQTIKLAQKAQEAQAVLQAVQAQQAQVANAQQMSMNSSMAAPTPQGAGQASAEPTSEPAA